LKIDPIRKKTRKFLSLEVMNFMMIYGVPMILVVEKLIVWEVLWRFEGKLELKLLDMNGR
jgi:hypothetical protein